MSIKAGLTLKPLRLSGAGELGRWGAGLSDYSGSVIAYPRRAVGLGAWGVRGICFEMFIF